MNADLHAHSIVSDGLLTPTALVQRAHANGVELLALTDHDEVSGLAEARVAADAVGLRFINGVEVSVSFEDQTVHIVGLNIRADEPVLLQGLMQVRAGRDVRAQKIAESLAKIGIPDALEGALRYAGNPAALGRAHFARYMVEQGIAKDTTQIFMHYLVPGKPGYVEHRWASLRDAVGWIRAAGGMAVLAHPGRYRLSTVKMRSLYAQFAAAGGLGIEVVTSAHTPQMTAIFANVARKYGFYASRGADFHGPDEGGFDLGRAPVLPSNLQAIWTCFTEGS